MKLFSAALLWACCGAASAADPEMFWFKNETRCGDAGITVRSYCEVSHHTNAVNPRNTGCTEQELQIAQPGSKTVSVDLLKYEPVGDDFHIASSLRCVAAGKQHYLLVGLDTGGSCDGCEIDAILSLDGRWKRHGKHWLSTPAGEQRQIRLGQPDWRREPVYDITNTVRE